MVSDLVFLEIVAGEFRSSSHPASDLASQQLELRGEFPSSRNGSTTIMLAHLVSSSSEPWSDAVVRMLDVFVIHACFVMCSMSAKPDTECDYAICS